MAADVVTDIATLDAIYGAPVAASIKKVADHITPLYGNWISRSRFCVISTVGPDGTDGTPRGDSGPVVRIADKHTLLMPDWRGNNRIDSLRNIVSDGRISLMFMVPGAATVVRVNGTAVISVAADLITVFDDRGVAPRSVIKVTVAEVYIQCARAIHRSNLWNGADESAGLPLTGDFLAEAEAGFDAAAYNADSASRAGKNLW